MEKVYDRIDWHNNTSPDVNENNLNRMSKALDDLDDRVILIAGDVLVTVPQLREMLEDCTELEQRLEAMTENPPYIGENGHWYIWDTDTGAYVDSGIDASITVEIADITMLEPNATPYVTNTGTDTDPIFHLFIPRGQSGKGISSIAKTSTSGYVDTYTITYTDNTSTTYTVTNGRNTDQVTSMPTAAASLVGTIYQYIGASTSSFTHGFYYECQNVNGSYQWVNIPVGNDPVEVSNSDPYIYRQGKGNLADIEIEGASVGWNQLARVSLASDTKGLTITNDGLKVTVSGTPTSTGNINIAVCDAVPEDHVVCMYGMPSGLSSIKLQKYNNSGSIDDTGSGIVVKKASRYSSLDRMRLVLSSTAVTYNFSLYPQFVDLTLLFGSTIADAIYAMEQATEGAGVAFFRKYFPKDYYAYDAGSIQSVCVGSRKVTGKNLYDITDSLIGSRVTLNGSYGFTNTVTDSKTSINIIISYSTIADASSASQYVNLVNTGSVGVGHKNYNITLPDNVKMLRIGHQGTTNNFYVYTRFQKGGNFVVSFDITSATPTIVGGVNFDNIMVRPVDIVDSTFEPYTSTTYPFDSTKELRGMFNLVNGELKANGDIYTADGNIQRKYGIVDLGTKTWTRVASSASGIYYFYFDGDSTIKTQGNNGVVWPNLLTPKYSNTTSSSIAQGTAPDKSFGGYDGHGIRVRDDAYTDAATFKTAMSGVYLVYELTTPTTEAAQPYQNPQRAYIDGTEEFIDGLTRDVMIPVGNNSVYQQDKVLPSIEDYVDAVAEVVKADILTTTNEEENVDLDTLTTPGMYFVKNSDAGSYNYPSSVTSGVLTVIHYKQSGESMIRQELQSANYLCYRNGMWLNGSWVFGAGWFVFTGT